MECTYVRHIALDLVYLYSLDPTSICFSIPVFRAKHSEMKWVVNKGGSNDDGDGGGFGGESAESVIRLRGLPYDCSKDDIKTFFEGEPPF